MQSLGFTQEAGFLDEDLEAVFAAIDEDGSRTLEYNELAMALQLTRTFQGVVDRLRPNAWGRRFNRRDNYSSIASEIKAASTAKQHFHW